MTSDFFNVVLLCVRNGNCITYLPDLSSFELNKSTLYSSARCPLRQGHVKAECTYSAAQVSLHISYLKTNRLFSHIKSQFSLINSSQIMPNTWMEFAIGCSSVCVEWCALWYIIDCGVPAGSQNSVCLVCLFVFVHG